MTTNTHWTKKTLTARSSVKNGDTFMMPDKTRGVVRKSWLSIPTDHNRKLLGPANQSDEAARAFASRAYGYEAGPGDCPISKEGDYPALTRLLRACMGCRPSRSELAAIHAAKVAESEQKAKKTAESKRAAAIRAKLPAPLRRVTLWLDAHPEAFGCQRSAVLDLIGVAFGVDGLAGKVAK